MISIDPLRSCFEGAIPASLTTVALDGTPNIAWLSQVQYIDNQHIALTYQFFNKTRANILENPNGLLTVVDPETGAEYRMKVHYLRTETSGPLFENMKAKLAGIASHTGMAGIFKLIGSDIYSVSSVERVKPGHLAQVGIKRNWLPVLRQVTSRMSQCSDLDSLLNETLEALASQFSMNHAIVLIWDECAQRLYTVASTGYNRSGVGAEIALDEGVIGVAARARTPIRISYMTSEYTYSQAMRNSSEAAGLINPLERAIPFPGLEESHSQLAVPIMLGTTLYGVIFVESPLDLRFTYDDEDALMTIANQMALIIQNLPLQQDAVAESTQAIATEKPINGNIVTIRHFKADHSIFLNDDYLIKGVAGAIFWKLVQDYHSRGRDTFTNRELRLSGDLSLPDIVDNLEARLVLLQKRLCERQACVQMDKVGRGRFKLSFKQPIQLSAAD